VCGAGRSLARGLRARHATRMGRARERRSASTAGPAGCSRVIVQTPTACRRLDVQRLLSASTASLRSRECAICPLREVAGCVLVCLCGAHTNALSAHGCQRGSTIREWKLRWHRSRRASRSIREVVVPGLGADADGDSHRGRQRALDCGRGDRRRAACRPRVVRAACAGARIGRSRAGRPQRCAPAPGPAAGDAPARGAPGRAGLSLG
jgi:hypothetical protein